MESGKTHLYRISRADVVLIVGVLALAAIFILRSIPYGSVSKDAQERVFVYHDNQPVLEADLTKDNVYPILAGKMHIEIRSGRVRVLDSDCPKQRCVQTGWIERLGQSIVCGPNHVLVEIKVDQSRVQGTEKKENGFF